MKPDILLALTAQDREDALQIRRQVFVREQGVPESIEVDAYEEDADHFLVLLNGRAVGAGRLRTKKSYAKFERIATLREFRGKGVGQALMQVMQTHARLKFPSHLPAMHAQASAISFYEKVGWVSIGETFLEAKIPHRVLIFPPKEREQIEALLIWNDPEAREDIRAHLKRI